MRLGPPIKPRHSAYILFLLPRVFSIAKGDRPGLGYLPPWQPDLSAASQRPRRQPKPTRVEPKWENLQIHLRPFDQVVLPGTDSVRMHK
ncbi:hypothetical protein F5Y09DRAFT_84063 [Xylaria sp. FL1042]|nr:hypothetical protein F5Y09DRAFT_84063 [Xylaria sp. FL1042]